jgi:hypothetical protein
LKCGRRLRSICGTAFHEDLITELEGQQRKNERLGRKREWADQERDRYSS